MQMQIKFIFIIQLYIWKVKGDFTPSPAPLGLLPSPFSPHLFLLTLQMLSLTNNIHKKIDLGIGYSITGEIS